MDCFGTRFSSACAKTSPRGKFAEKRPACCGIERVHSNVTASGVEAGEPRERPPRFISPKCVGERAMANVSILPKDLAPVLPRTWTPVLLSVLRIMTGLLFLQHGTSKILGFPATAMHEHGAMLYFTGLME